MQVIQKLYEKVMQRVPFLALHPLDFVTQLAPKLKQLAIPRNEFVIRAGDVLGSSPVAGNLY